MSPAASRTALSIGIRVGRTSPCSGTQQYRDICQNVSGMRCHIRDAVRTSDDAGTVDQERHAFRKVRILIVGRTTNAVGRPYSSIGIAQQRICKPLGVGESKILRRSIERSAQYRAVRNPKVFGIVTQRLSLNRSTGGGCLRIPPKKDPASPEIREADLGTVLVGKAKRRSRGSIDDHPQMLGERTRRRLQAVPGRTGL